MRAALQALVARDAARAPFDEMPLHIDILQLLEESPANLELAAVAPAAYRHVYLAELGVDLPIRAPLGAKISKTRFRSFHIHTGTSYKRKGHIYNLKVKVGTNAMIWTFKYKDASQQVILKKREYIFTTIGSAYVLHSQKRRDKITHKYDPETGHNQINALVDGVRRLCDNSQLRELLDAKSFDEALIRMQTANVALRQAVATYPFVATDKHLLLAGCSRAIRRTEHPFVVDADGIVRFDIFERYHALGRAPAYKIIKDVPNTSDNIQFSMVCTDIALHLTFSNEASTKTFAATYTFGLDANTNAFVFYKMIARNYNPAQMCIVESIYNPDGIRKSFNRIMGVTEFPA